VTCGCSGCVAGLWPPAHEPLWRAGGNTTAVSPVGSVMDTTAAHDALAANHQGILVTLRGDGRPQTSNIAYAFADGVARISVTDSRAKTANLRRDPRAVLHVVGDTFWQYVSADGPVELSDVSTEPGDDAGRELLALHDAVSAEPHSDPDEFFRAMVDDERLVVRLRPTGFAGIA
jgi:PPOX class probable F420-dependent enzyme